VTYYDELGLSPRASEAEVRRSYKRLTLLLHPDQHQDPEINALADAQMKRLNAIIAMLLDPEQRRIYDREILCQTLTVRQTDRPTPLIWLRNNRGWIMVTGAFFLFLGAALLIPDFDSSRPPVLAKTQSPSPQPKPAVEPAIRLSPSAGRVDARVSRRPPQASRRSEATFRKPEVASKQPEALRPSPFTMSASDLPAPPEPLSTPASPVASKATQEASPLAGKWVFTPDPMDRQDPKRFPAEYVELTILAAEGRLRGNYRSRYKLPDHAMSPFANFAFEGASSATSFDWLGDGGARGQVTLRQQSHDTLQVSWFATKMGSELSLGSGSATVFRFR
jgi:curved DNA-binding protein CbpA